MLPAAGPWPTISNDGRKLAYRMIDNRVSVWKKDLQHPDAAPVEMFASTPPQNNAPYSPDGRYVSFTSLRFGA